MRFGVGLFSGQRPPGSSRTHAELYRDMLDHASLADQVGLDSFWLSEHHFASDGYHPAVLPLSGALLATTNRLKIGTSILIASLYNPLRLAEDLIALDLLGRGRFIAGLGHTYRADEFRPFGIEPESDSPRLEEIVAILRLAFSGKPFAYTGRYYTIPEVNVTPAPYTDGGPPLVVTGNGVADRDAERTGRLGIMYMIDPAVTWDAAIRLVSIYDAALPTSVKPELQISCYGFISDNGDAWDLMRPSFNYMRQVYDEWQGRSSRTISSPEGYRLLLGTSDQVADQVDAYRKQFGERVHLKLRLGYPGMDPAAVARAIELFGGVAKAIRGKG